MRDLTCDTLEPLLMNGSSELVEGVRRDEGRAILTRMGKGAPSTNAAAD